MAAPAPIHAGRGDGRTDTAAHRRRSGKTSTPGRLTHGHLNRRPNLHSVDGRSLGHFWSGVSEGTRGRSWNDLCANVAALPRRTLRCYAQAGDLPGIGDAIDAELLL